MSQMTLLDRLVIKFDSALRAACGTGVSATRPPPVPPRSGAELPDAERKLSSALMRVNHSGEVCAQALYVGQALTARAETVRAAMQAAAREEIDHLAWCRERIEALDGRTSWLNPLWFAGSLLTGLAAGAAGDRVSLGFLAETERQVVRHLDGHLKRLPAADAASRAIVTAMLADEAKHATTAVRHGAVELPSVVRKWMALQARVMTTVAFWV
jgi:ubiquinone biosynthesis monooxygenase Coq7